MANQTLMRVDKVDLHFLRTEGRRILIEAYPELRDLPLSDSILFKKSLRMLSDNSKLIFGIMAE